LVARGASSEGLHWGFRQRCYKSEKKAGRPKFHFFRKLNLYAIQSSCPRATRSSYANTIASARARAKQQCPSPAWEEKDVQGLFAHHYYHYSLHKMGRSYRDRAAIGGIWAKALRLTMGIHGFAQKVGN
jgi:hypothetical protein